jgi:hypothetical protein
MSNARAPKILAPYGAIQFAVLSTKVGGEGKNPPVAPLAPYGELKFSSLATKVGVNPKDGPVSAPSLAPYGAVNFVSLSTKVGQIKDSKVPAGS